MNQNRVLHLITGLESGGAENVLFQLLQHQDRSEFPPVVVSLTTFGDLGPKIQKLGVPVHALGARGLLSMPRAALKLIKLVREIKPSIIQTWMYHSNFMGGIIGKLFSGAKMIWCIHHTDLNPRLDKRSTILISNLSALLSNHIPDVIVCVSNETRRLHGKSGYASKGMVVIHNGFDLAYFSHDSEGAARIRESLNIGHNEFVIGMAARFHPQKDHSNLFQAAKMLLKETPHVHFILCGEGVDRKNPDIQTWLTELEDSQPFHLIGKREDMPAIYSAMTIATLSSAYGEAFPMMVGEAMATGTPCVVTDVGDAGLMVGSNGVVVPPKSPADLCNGWMKLLRMSSGQIEELGHKARQRITQEFSVEKMVSEYSMLWMDLLRD